MERTRFPAGQLRQADFKEPNIMNSENQNTQVATLKAGTAILARSGKEVGRHYVLGAGPIAAMKKDYRAAGMSSREASERIAELLKGNSGHLAWAQASAAMEMARSKGMYPTGFDLRNKSFVIRGSAVPEVKESKAMTREAALAALGITAEELALLKAEAK